MEKATDSRKAHGDRPAREIEITPEMIEAGAAILSDCGFFDLSPTIAEVLAEKVFLEMRHLEIRRQ